MYALRVQGGEHNTVVAMKDANGHALRYPCPALVATPIFTILPLLALVVPGYPRTLYVPCTFYTSSE